MFRHFSATVMAFLLFAGCGGGGGGGNGSGAGGNNSIDNGIFETYPGGISRIWANGTELLGNTGGYYAIGTCPGFGDDPGVNFTTVGVYDNFFYAPSPNKCPASPYSIVPTELAPNVLRLYVTIGPMVAAASTVSVPLDTNKNLFDKFAFNGNSYWVNGCSPPRKRSGSGGNFTDIPQDCGIPALGGAPVGVAFTRSMVLWGEIVSTSLGVTIRRQLIDGGNLRDLKFYRHPNTHNIEWSFGSVKKGETVYFVEDIYVQ